jgi:hypothetical protein
MKAYRGKEIGPNILNLDTRWRWVFILTPWPLHHEERVTSSDRTQEWLGPKAGLGFVIKYVGV